MKKILVALVLLSCGLTFGAFAGPVNVNTANAKTLAQELTDVGTVKANAIVDYREAHGPFDSLDELKNVKGIGDATIAENKEDIRFSSPEK